MKTKRVLALSLVLALIALMAFGCASNPQSKEAAVADTSWQYPQIVDAAFVGQYAKVPMQEDVMIIDSRPYKPKYVKGHIPMAVNMPYTQFDKLTHLLPENKDALLVFYCGGLKCKLSHKAAFKAEALGYKNVKVFAEGFPGWMAVPGNYASVSVEWVKAQVDKKADMLVVDSRPKRKKYDKGHIPGAVSIPTTKFDSMTDQLPQEKDKLLVFYCGGLKCKLSHKGAQKAIALGHTNVKVFSTGYPSWKAYVGQSGQVANIKAGKEEGSIEIVAFETIMRDNPGSIYLVDVRDADEFALGSFKGAVNIPVENLEAQIKSLPTDKPVVFVCSTGARSGESFYMVQDLRPELKDVYYIEAEITFNKDGSYKIVPPQS
ncbi:MAG: rhodanese-like domain-containing protein [Desulfobacterales bacterium]|nr:rhodanese-like domain-containing protein [Desulfobacterales bacterium]